MLNSSVPTGLVKTTLLAVSFIASTWNSEELILSRMILSYEVKSACTSQDSTCCRGCTVADCSAKLWRIPDPSGAIAATSILSSNLSAIPCAALQLVLSSKSFMYGCKNIQTPPIIVIIIARSMIVPRISLTALSSRKALRFETRQPVRTIFPVHNNLLCINID